MITVIQFGEGRILNCHTEADEQVMLEFGKAIEGYDPQTATKKHKKRLKRAWLKLEHNMNKEYPRSAGIDRKEVFL